MPCVVEVDVDILEVRLPVGPGEDAHDVHRSALAAPEQPAEHVAETAEPATSAAPATEQPAEHVAEATASTVAAAEQATEPVGGVDLGEVDPTLEERPVVLPEGLGERGCAGRVLGVRLHPAEQRRERRAHGLVGFVLADAELAGQLADRDLAQQLVET